MDDIKRPIAMDATGYEILTSAVLDLLNKYPGLQPGERIKFEELKEDEGIAFSADSGALVYNEKIDITDTVHQICQYPFFIIYRSAATRERQKLNAQKFLDTLGKWLCKESVIINGAEARLKQFPELSKGRAIKRILRENSYGIEPQENGVQDWLLPVTIQYTNEFNL